MTLNGHPAKTFKKGKSRVQDDDRYQLYYRGRAHRPGKALEFVCYAQSTDGITWTRPSLGLVEYEGSKANNILLSGRESHAFSPFKDANPNCPPEERYKGVGPYDQCLWPFKSADGIHWSLMADKPITRSGGLDSLNLVFYDTVLGVYREYHRDFLNNVRDVETSVSKDFLNFPKEHQWLSYPGAPTEHLYTNGIQPYFRAPHIYLGFPMRHVDVEIRGKNHSFHDVVFMSSRDGYVFKRWSEAFIRPGPQRSRWVHRNNNVACGIVTTRSDLPDTPDVLTFYSLENYDEGNSLPGFPHLRRYTLRQDGFVSIRAPRAGGAVVTKPFTFTGKHLRLNYATSAAGRVRVGVLDAESRPAPGFDIEACDVLIGDELDREVIWTGANLGALAGKPVRLRIELVDADVYAMQFTP